MIGIYQKFFGKDKFSVTQRVNQQKAAQWANINNKVVNEKGILNKNHER
jgi:hypothetical protein